MGHYKNVGLYASSITKHPKASGDALPCAFNMRSVSQEMRLWISSWLTLNPKPLGAMIFQTFGAQVGLRGQGSGMEPILGTIFLYIM